ncbi:MAG: hypothetical protein J7J52_05605 [Deltaproteobacteria bacterium]|nr:hypothetical protein [Deltaproteobacteria bacterium]
MKTQKKLESFGAEFPSAVSHKQAKRSWSGKQKRAYHRVLSGLYLNLTIKGLPIRFMTLTSANESPDFDYQNDSFSALVKRIRRMTPAKFVKEGWISPNDLKKYFPGKALNEHLTFNYFKVHTNEGNGVFHILYSGDFIPQKWLKAQWMALHNAWNVNVKSVSNNRKKVASYVVGQYIVNQDSTFTRFSWSSGWLMRGAVAMWNYLKGWYSFPQVLGVFHGWMRSFVAERSQFCLTDFG